MRHNTLDKFRMIFTMIFGRIAVFELVEDSSGVTRTQKALGHIGNKWQNMLITFISYQKTKFLC